MPVFYAVKRGKEYWVSGGGERSVYSVRPVPNHGDDRFQIIREWWLTNDDDSPVKLEVVETHATERGARMRMGRLLKPFTSSGRHK